jgi:hypothetical protein
VLVGGKLAGVENKREEESQHSISILHQGPGRVIVGCLSRRQGRGRGKTLETLAAMFPFLEREQELGVSFYNAGTGMFMFSECGS